MLLLGERPFFRTLVEHMLANESSWRAWFDSPDPSVVEVCDALVLFASRVADHLMATCANLYDAA